MPDNTTDRLSLSFGRNSATMPDDTPAVWGARLIWPNDLLYDRQDLKSRDDDARSALIDWLNGPGHGDGAISEMQKALRERNYEFFPNGQKADNEAVLYEDERGIIVGSPQGSYGYVYVAGWLKPAVGD